MKHVVLLCAAWLAIAGCGKKSEQQEPPAPAPGSAPAPPPTPSPDPVAGSGSAPAPAPGSAAPTADPAAPAPTAPVPTADAALLAAAKAYVDKSAAKGLKYDLEAEAIEGDYARFAVKPKAKDQDGATVFMQRKGGKWTGVDMGTSIPCADLEKAGFPEKVRTGCD